METFNTLLIIAAFILSIICFSLIIFVFINSRRTRKISRKLIFTDHAAHVKNQSVKESYFAWLMRNGVSIFKKPCKFLLRKIPFINHVFDGLVIMLNEKDINCNKESVFSTFFSAMLVIIVLVSLLFSSIIAGLAVSLCTCACLVLFIKSRQDKRSAELRNSVPDALRSMSVCFGAGYTLFQTFQQLAKDSAGGLQKLFSKTSHKLQTGSSISESLKILKETDDVPELAFVAVALDVQHKTGGSMKPVLDSAKDMVDSKLELLKMLQVQTAQAKLSARIVIILPFALIAIFSIISPNFLSPFFNSLLGFVILGLACAMQFSGIFLVRKMLNLSV